MLMRSCVVRLRPEELNTRVRSGETSPKDTCRAVSSNSEDNKASKAPGTGFRLNTGRCPCNAFKGVGHTST